MSKSTSMSLKTKGNQRLRNIISSNELALNQELIDAELFNEIAHSLVSLRKKSNLTQKELAEKLGVKQSNISRWEQAGYQGYKVKILSKLASILGGRLFISIVPFTSFEYFREAFSYTKQTKITEINADGSIKYTDNMTSMNFIGERMVINAKSV